ncbi:MAG: hypothetical protein ACLFRK_00995 [Candidatus Nanohaloarchaea archaeon]
MDHYLDEMELLTEENDYRAGPRLRSSIKMIEHGTGKTSEKVMAQYKAERDYIEIQNSEEHEGLF